MQRMLTVVATKADGTWYRTWQAYVERLEDNLLVTVGVPGSRVADRERGGWVMKHYIRGHYWFDRPLNLLEVFTPDGTLIEIYVNVGSWPVLDGDQLTFADYELDVSLEGDGPPRIIDEDEFAEAIDRYGYSAEFQAHCRAAAQAGLALAASWTPGTAPDAPPLADPRQP